MSTFTFILVIGVIWSATAQRSAKTSWAGSWKPISHLVCGGKAQTAVGDFYENGRPARREV